MNKGKDVHLMLCHQQPQQVVRANAVAPIRSVGQPVCEK